ncbi:MAG: hypothetical protein WD473_02880 [Acidimicrobiia bacterium]
MTDHEQTHEVRESRRTVDRRVISPAQIVAGIIGLVLVILGGVALARVGFDSLTGDTATVLGFDHTALMGLINVVAGLFYLGAAASSGGRGTLIGLSLVAVAFGAIVAIEPNVFDSALGGGREIGILYIVIGVVGLLAALAFPTTVVDRVATQEDGASTIG